MYNRFTRKQFTAMRARMPATMLLLATLQLASASSWSAPHVAANLGEVNVNDGFADLVEAVRPAVVNISTGGHADAPDRRQREMQPELEEFFRRFFGDQFETPHGTPRNAPPAQRKSRAVGSGFVIDADGLVVTNHHVIDGADEIEVVFEDGARLKATLRGYDRKTDLALLEVDAGKPLPYVAFGDSDGARVGDWVIAIGNPFGLGGSTTGGIISARGRDIQSGPLDDFIQIDAPINRGNSGGPLFNTEGEVIGVNSAIFSPNGGNVGIGFAIPSAIASNIVTQLRKHGAVRHGFLGVHIQPVSDDIADSLGLPEAKGALVSQVVADSPAESAGIEAGDVIIKYDGADVVRMRDLPKLVALTEDERTVKIIVWRDERKKTLSVTITGRGDGGVIALPNDAPKLGVGLAVETLTAENRRQYNIAEDAKGALVMRVDANGSAAKSGLRRGDLIQKIDKQLVATPKEVKDALTAAANTGKKSALFLIARNQQTRFVVVSLKPNS